MGTSAEQYAAGVCASNASWMLGAELLGPALAGVRGLRTFRAEPAYQDHAVLGTDPQPKHMRDYVMSSADHGGVHFNAGIPNHAFFLAATAIGGNTWDTTTKVWYEAFTKGLNEQATFAQAAAATQAAARRMLGEGEARMVERAWRDVGIEPKASR